MSYKPDETDWMAYLYGGMNEEEKERFEAYVARTPRAMDELEKLRNIRHLLGFAKDKEVIAPPVLVAAEPASVARGQRFWNAPYFRTVFSVAASLLLLLLAARFTGTSVVVSHHQLKFSFGDSQEGEMTSPPAAPNGLDQDQVKQMIDEAIGRNNKVVTFTLEQTQKNLDASIRNNLAVSSGKIDHLLREASEASQQQIRQYVDALRAENRQQVKDYFQLTSAEQKKYIENLLVDFAQYLQQQRSNDLQLMQSRMTSIEQNTNLFKQETEEILSSIITTVGTPVNGETKN